MSMMKQLTEMQLDSICGGNNITFNPTPGATACGGGQSGGSLGVTHNINSYNNNIQTNSSIIIIQNLTLINSVLAIDVTQANYI
ncbi:MAG: hypothetical protein FJX03_05450 [Alphaproteobacteria bacterium]|nr:hypothetical protein [Alphaproteobacteria bacterium]